PPASRVAKRSSEYPAASTIRSTSARPPTPTIRPAQIATAASGSSRRPTSPWDEPIRGPPAIVTISRAPTTRRPGRSGRSRPPSMTRKLTTPGRPRPGPTASSRDPRLGSRKPQLQRLQRAEVAQSQVVGGGGQPILDRRVGRCVHVVRDVEERRDRSEPDELRFEQLDPVLGSLRANRLPDAPERGHAEVEQVHRDLGLARQPIPAL